MVYNEKVHSDLEYRKIRNRLASKHFELEQRTDTFEVWSNYGTEETVVVQFEK